MTPVIRPTSCTPLLSCRWRAACCCGRCAAVEPAPLLLRQDPAAVADALWIARPARWRIRQTFGISAGDNEVAGPLALVGPASPPAAALAMSLSPVTMALQRLRMRRMESPGTLIPVSVSLACRDCRLLSGACATGTRMIRQRTASLSCRRIVTIIQSSHRSSPSSIHKYPIGAMSARNTASGSFSAKSAGPVPRPGCAPPASSLGISGVCAIVVRWNGAIRVFC